jgi:ABC-type Co2+ transport system permease subunit
MFSNLFVIGFVIICLIALFVHVYNTIDSVPNVYKLVLSVILGGVMGYILPSLWLLLKYGSSPGGDASATVLVMFQLIGVFVGIIIGLITGFLWMKGINQ